MKTLFFSIFILLTGTLFSQSGNTIHGEIRNGAGKRITLSSMYGEKLTLMDSAFVDPSGHVAFSLKPATPEGLYRISLAKDNMRMKLPGNKIKMRKKKCKNG